MNCLDCKDVELTEDSVDTNRDRDLFEITYKCSKCKAVFFGTIYREEGGEKETTEIGPED